MLNGRKVYRCYVQIRLCADEQMVFQVSLIQVTFILTQLHTDIAAKFTAKINPNEFYPHRKIPSVSLRLHELQLPKDVTFTKSNLQMC